MKKVFSPKIGSSADLHLMKMSLEHYMKFSANRPRTKFQMNYSVISV